jgi:hypothetical protein
MRRARRGPHINYTRAQALISAAAAERAAAAASRAHAPSCPSQVIGLLEFVSECKPILEASGQKHYVRGGKPGVYPSFKKAAPALGFPASAIPFDFFDPFNLQSKMTPEQKERGLLAEINNGRLAMIGASHTQPRRLSS